jgi:hypothetical protein
MIQEHLSLKRQKIYSKSGTWKFESVSGQRALLQATTMGFRWKGQQSVAFQE